MRSQNYILVNKTAVPVEDTITWAKWFEKNDRVVAKTNLDGYRISTVFLGLDHRFSDDGPPLIFETMVFAGNGWSEVYCDRCSTWDEAEAMHLKAVDQVKSGRIQDERKG